MAFTDWDSYQDLLRQLSDAAAQWASETSFAQFDSAIRSGFPDLVEGERGYAALSQQLADGEGYGGDEEGLFRHLRIVLLAQSPDALELGPEWTGYWISRDVADAEVWSGDRYAAPDQWWPMEISARAAGLRYDEETGLMFNKTSWFLRDGRTEVWPDETSPGAFTDEAGNRYVHGELQADTVTDLRQQHFDVESGRWRRWSDDGEFEYYHDADGVWERSREGQWYRLQDDVGQWLPYDGPSQTWWYREQWRPEKDLAGLAALPVPGAQPPEETVTAAGQIDQALESGFEAAVSGFREAGVTEDELSDEEIEALIGQQVAELLAAEVPEFQKLAESD